MSNILDSEFPGSPISTNVLLFCAKIFSPLSRQAGSAALLLLGLFSFALASHAAAPVPLKGALLAPAQATGSKLSSLEKEGFNSVVLYLEDSASEEENQTAA